MSARIPGGRMGLSDRLKQLDQEQGPLGPAPFDLDDVVRGGRRRRTRRTAVRAVAAVALVAAVFTVVSLGPVNRFLGQRPVTPGSVTVRPTPGVPRDYSLLPEEWSSEKGGLDAGQLSAVTRANGVVTLHVDRKLYYVGPGATAVDAKEADLVPYVERDPDGSRTLTFGLDPKASLEAEYRLRRDWSETSNAIGRQKITLDQFLKASAVQLKGRDAAPIWVWLRHSGGPDGPVTALAEQYTP